jgi:ribosomal protein S18 acetylase RimI-like enzyme
VSPSADYPPSLVIELLDSKHERASFKCGTEALDTYLKARASQDMRRHAATVFVARQQTDSVVRGYYALSMASVLLDKVPSTVARTMPRYPTVPAVRLGRLAVDQSYQGQGLGRHLLIDAMARCIGNDVAWTALIVDAKDESARAFYQAFGFESLLDDPNHLYLMRKTVEPLFE